MNKGLYEQYAVYLNPLLLMHKAKKGISFEDLQASRNRLAKYCSTHNTQPLAEVLSLHNSLLDQYHNSAKEYYQKFLSQFRPPPPVFQNVPGEDTKSMEEYVDGCIKEIHIEEWRVDRGVLQQCLYIPLQNLLKKHYKTQELKRKLQVLKDQKQDHIQQRNEQKQRKEDMPKTKEKEGPVENQEKKDDGPVEERSCNQQVKPSDDTVAKEVVENVNQQVESIASISNDKDNNQIKQQEVRKQPSMEGSDVSMQETKVDQDSSAIPQEKEQDVSNECRSNQIIEVVEDGPSPALDDNIEFDEEGDESDPDYVEDGEEEEVEGEGEEEGEEEEEEGEGGVEDEEEGGVEEDYNLEQEEVVAVVDEKGIGKSTTEPAHQEKEKSGEEMEEGELPDSTPSKGTKDTKNVSNNVNRKRSNPNTPKVSDSASKRPRQSNAKHVNANKAQNKNQSQTQSQSQSQPQSGSNKVKKAVAGVNKMNSGLRSRRGRGRGRTK